VTANLARMLPGNARRYADVDALVFEGRRWTHAALEAEVSALAAGLLDLGLGRSSRVAVVASNVPEFLLLGLALSRVGGVLVPLNYRLTAGELTHLVRHSGAVAIATVPEYADLVEAAVADVPEDLVRLALEPVDPSWTSVRDLVQAHAGAVVRDVPVEADDLQRVVYTSGTTSLPKGVRLSHGNVNANIHAQVVDLGLTRTDRILNIAPLYHVGGTDLPGYGIWHVGGTMVLQRRFDPEAVLDAIESERVTGMVVAATMLDMVRRAADARATTPDLTSVRWLIFSQVTPALFRVARALFPNARLIEGYGLTETCSGLTYLDEAHMESKLGSVGIPVPWVEVRVVDPTTGVDVPVGADGEVVARGPKVSSGYLDDPAATAAVFRDGWFHTGDVGCLDEDGYLWIRDRLKDMIRSGGENMASAEIEHVLADHPDVLAVSVVGAPHPTWQEVPVAFVVGRPGLVVESLVAHARSRLGKFKVPKEVYVVPDLPTNPSGKVLKRELREARPTMTPAWSYE
jgi:fatty-acyl-CoA synthase